MTRLAVEPPTMLECWAILSSPVVSSVVTDFLLTCQALFVKASA